MKKRIYCFFISFLFFATTIFSQTTFSVSDSSKSFYFSASDFTGYPFVSLTNHTNQNLNLRWFIDFGKSKPPLWNMDLQVADSIYTGVLDSSDFVLDTMLFNDQVILFCFPNNAADTLNATITIVNVDNPSEKLNIYFTIGAYNATNTVDTELEKNIALFPNPAKDYLMFDLPNDLILKDIYIINTLGQKLISFKEKNTRLNITSLSKGVYRLILLTDKGKIVKQFMKF